METLRVSKEKRLGHNTLAATQRQPSGIMNEKDNLLKYEISDDKEENELLDFLMVTKKKNDGKFKDGELINIDSAN